MYGWSMGLRYLCEKIFFLIHYRGGGSSPVDHVFFRKDSKQLDISVKDGEETYMIFGSDGLRKICLE